MKISIDKIKVTPNNMEFNFCVYGEPDSEVSDWIKFWGFKTEKSGPFTNILIPEGLDINEVFIKEKTFKYVDGFSPNLNKSLHIGHLSNLIIAKSFQSMGIGENFISILGDTLTGNEENQKNLKNFNKICKEFADYKVGKIFMASEMKYDNNLLTDGEGDYGGTKVFDLGDEKIVGIKNNGNTTYFYQDVALAYELQDSTLYLTGHEQDNHFNSLKKLFPKTEHIGLGLVTTKGSKMSSSLGNVILMEDVVEYLNNIFDNDHKLVFNVLAGQILKSDPKVNKNLNMDTITNPKNSQGLYISYTMASLKSAGVVIKEKEDFNSNELKFSYIKAFNQKNPSILFNALYNHCKKINKLYQTHQIKGNDLNNKMFGVLLEDLELSAKKLGLFSINKV